MEPQNRHLLAMGSTTATPTSEKALPPRPDSRSTIRDGRFFPPTRSPRRDSARYVARTPLIRSLEAENKILKAELVKNYQLQLRSEDMVDVVRAATERIKNAILKFRKEQKRIEEKFEEEKAQIETEFHASNFF
jgi:hypothetical protein